MGPFSGVAYWANRFGVIDIIQGVNVRGENVRGGGGGVIDIIQGGKCPGGGGVIDIIYVLVQ